MVHNGLTHTLTRSYSDSGYLGRDIGFSLDSGYGVGYEFDAYGRMNAVTHSNFASFAPFVVNYSYLSNSDLISVVSNSYGLASTRSYESDRNLITSIENTFGTNVISRYAYGNDPLARRTNRIDTGSAISAGATNVFGYDSRSQLTSAQMTTNGYAYSYDPIGNRESATNNTDGTLSYTANELNQYTEITNGSLKSLFYDPDGSLTNDGEWAYTWDGENHLISVESANLTNGANKVESDFDYKGRRIRKTVSVYTNSVWSVVSTNHFLWDQWNPIQEISFRGGTTNTRSFAYGLDISGTLDGAGGIGGLLSMTQGTNVYFYCADGNGNVVQLVDETGATVAEYEYSPFGEIKTSSGTMATENPFRFSSKYYDDRIALLIYELRPVRPKMLGRFLSRDPLGVKGGINDYSFIKNGPLSRKDVLGLITYTETVLYEEYLFWTRYRGEWVRALTDKKTQIEAWRPKGIFGRGMFWCHGYTFDGYKDPKGPFSIPGGYVPIVLRDEWNRVPCMLARKGDIVVFWGRSGNMSGVPPHSGKVDRIETSGCGLDEGKSMIKDKIGPGGPPHTSRSFAVVSGFNGFYSCHTKRKINWTTGFPELRYGSLEIRWSP